MTIIRIANNTADPLEPTTFKAEEIYEKRDLQQIFKDSIEILVPDALVIAEEFSDWEDSNNRIDLLCIDRSARLVVVELKRTVDGGYMDLQAIRYAAMVAKMTFATAVLSLKNHLAKNNIDADAEQMILDHLDWEEPQEDFATEVCIVLASAAFSKELTTSIMWLAEHEIEIRCIKISPYKYEHNVFLDIQPIFPLPEATDYEVRLKAKEREERSVRRQNRDLTRFDLVIDNTEFENLPKRRLALNVIKEVLRLDSEILPNEVSPNKPWLIVDGEHTNETLKSATRNDNSSSANLRRFFTDDEFLIVRGCKTFAVSKNWGDETLAEVDRLIEEFDLSHVSYEPHP